MRATVEKRELICGTLAAQPVVSFEACLVQWKVNGKAVKITLWAKRLRRSLLPGDVGNRLASETKRLRGGRRRQKRELRRQGSALWPGKDVTAVGRMIADLLRTLPARLLTVQLQNHHAH